MPGVISLPHSHYRIIKENPPAYFPGIDSLSARSILPFGFRDILVFRGNGSDSIPIGRRGGNQCEYDKQSDYDTQCNFLVRSKPTINQYSYQSNESSPGIRENACQEQTSYNQVINLVCFFIC